ncbi:T7SS effector LXG polymorphic toxin [Metabacillus idriensis]|uniref:T7SS effector LXG polymorphic toxin n=1 Tax=Metabacillus idriensis TaxID=324768 RepID=UPI00174CC5E4|nr:T7SS effector LXG polymorphic toxin [Metabacillus idriensis]
MFLNAVYEADTLISAMENRANQYKDLREQLLVLKKTFKKISNSGEEFQGEGANAIKSFYEEQASIVNEWLTFIDMQIAFLRGVAAEAEEFKLSGHTYVDMDFLESDLLNGYRRSKDLVSDQKQDLDNILRSIDDLVSLQPFQTHTFDTYIDKAEKERKTTIEKVNELTEKLTYEYQQSEAVQEHIRNRFEALNDATKRGGQASPIYFDAKAYHNSSAYKLKDSVQHQAKSYLSFKKEQAERRKIEKLQKELETPNLSLDEYLKLAEDLGEENLTAEQKYIVDQIKASKQQGEIVKGVGAGLWEFTKDTATGLWNVLMTPPEQVLYDMGLAVINYDETIAQISEAIASSYERDMVNGNDYTRARWVTYAIATVGTSLVGTKGVDKVGKAGFAVGKKTVKNVKEGFANKLNPLNNSSAITTRYAFAGGIERVPYNTINSVGLKEKLLILSKILNNPRSRLPRNDGVWGGTPGSGKWYSDKPEVLAVTNGKPVEFIDGRPDFTPFKVGKDLVFKEGELKGDKNDFKLVYERIKLEQDLKSNNQAIIWLRKNKLTPHHFDSITIQLVPTDLHANVPHIGSASDLRGGY